ncbi:PAAR domain-containing protein [Lysobacter sp. GX 14042]|uniref:PAAR domain-containing protein n=1 Tax=Lysobacter sp. GX 14042 TaxID=2907155 RepID=UPI001F282F77|nr:PAAR domain-containing protein [Lysobacter sp. GX 14042]
MGDPTSSGGKVITGSPFTDIDGKPVARVNDSATCPKHQGSFLIVDGDTTTLIDGQPVALHGSKLSCGCSVMGVEQVRVFLDAGGGRAASARPKRSIHAASTGPATMQGLIAAMRPPEAANAAADDGTFSETFILRSAETGKPLAHRAYRILRSNGTNEQGTTDRAGATHLVTSGKSEVVRIELGEEAAV